MILKIITNILITFGILITQFFVFYFWSKEKSLPKINDSFSTILGASIFIGIMFSFASELYNLFNYKIIFFIVWASIISSYWFIINPLKYLFSPKKYSRDIELETEIKSAGYNYKILFTDAITDNAYATGIIPFYKIIIIGKNLKEKLDRSLLKAIVFHEIGHHEKKHILKLFFVNIVLQTIFVLMFFGINKLQYKPAFMEPLLVGVTGGFGGFIFYFIPNKIMYKLEYQADKYSAIHNEKSTMIDALMKLDALTGGKLSKGNSNHPPLKKRLENIEKI